MRGFCLEIVDSECARVLVELTHPLLFAMGRTLKVNSFESFGQHFALRRAPCGLFSNLNLVSQHRTH